MKREDVKNKIPGITEGGAPLNRLWFLLPIFSLMQWISGRPCRKRRCQASEGSADRQGHRHCQGAGPMPPKNIGCHTSVRPHRTAALDVLT